MPRASKGEREPERIRLQKILARCGIASRRGAEELIREGRVTVNGSIATLGTKAALDTDSVKVDGKRVRAPQKKVYLLLNKPRGLLTTVSDPDGRRTVMDLVPAKMKRGLFPVGRLDFDTEGLLLLTNDGDFGQRLAHPRHGCTKLYEVKVRGRPERASLDRLRAGIVLAGRRTAPCEIRARGKVAAEGEAGNTWLTVRLGEGRTRQIREMFQRVGHPVMKLRRSAIGPLRDPRLKPGTFRELSDLEVRRLLASLRA